MNQRPLSIRDILWLTISAMTLVIVLLVGREIVVQWQKLQKIESLREARDLSDALFDTNDKLSVERDVAFAMLYAPDRQDIADLRARLEESRRDTDRAFDSSNALLEKYVFLQLAALHQNLKTHMAGIRTLRSEIDRNLRLSKKDRDPALPQHWYDESTAIIIETQDLWTSFIRHFTDINPIVTQHLRYRHFLRIITDYTGRERSLIGRLLMENADPTPEDVGKLLRWQGTIELSWKTAKLLADQSGLYPSVGPAFKDAQSHYQTMYDMVRDIFYVPGARRRASYPIGVDLWFELSTQSFDSLNALKDASREAVGGYINQLADEGRRAIAIHLLVLVFALGLCFYCFRVIRRRVIRPINDMVDALVGTMQGKPVPLEPVVAGRQDEIGKLGEVLHAFKTSSDRYRALIEASTQVVWVWKEGAIEEMSPLWKWWEEMTGQPGSHIATYGWLEVAHPEDRERLQKIWGEALDQCRNFDMEYRLRAKNGQYRWVYVRAVALKNTEGTACEFVGTLADITQRKTAETELLAYTAALERSNKELDDFAYIASHDLKEPLRGIHNHSRFLLEDNADKLSEDSVQRLGRLVYLTQRMEKLVNDLLYFSRLGRQELAIQRTDLNELIRDIENTLDVFLAERKARILIPKPLPVVTCDQTRITEVFRNLITNAVKYNDKPDRMVEVGLLEGRHAPDGTKQAHVFYVKDNGKGIAREFYDEIFRIFKRLQSSKDAEDGTGVGLTFVKKIIERHGGRIWLESEEGAGTTFYFTLGEHAYDNQSGA